MADFSRCPSCGVEPSLLKFSVSGNGALDFRHLEGCTIGRAVCKSPVGALGGDAGYKCSRCSADFTLSNETPIRYVDGGGTGSRDCPICWAVAEADRS